MKKIAKILIVLGIGLIISGAFLLGCNHTPTPTPNSQVTVDTTRYTDVVLLNSSELDSVQVFVTMASTESIVGKFGMDSSNFNPDAKNPDGSLVKCKGIFWAKKGVKYHLGDTTTLFSVVICWGVDNQACTAAQSILNKDGKQKYPFGLNIFEFSVNTWWQNGKVTGANESFDISCVDGLHTMLKQSVTSFDPRNTNGLHPNFGSFWDFGVSNSKGLIPFHRSQNGIKLNDCVNVPGIFPYGCDWGYRSYQPPTPCTDPPYSIECSTKWGNINTSQLNRPGQGGQIICEFLGFTDNLVPMK
jgi:hypothetical protein